MLLGFVPAGFASAGLLALAPISQTSLSLDCYLWQSVMRIRRIKHVKSASAATKVMTKNEHDKMMVAMAVDNPPLSP